MAELNTNVLYYGDNLEILRNKDYFPDESVDLIYLDPPFNSQADYNVLFREATGSGSEAQIRAFSDTWRWDTAAERAYTEIVEHGPPDVASMIAALRQFIKANAMMAYLVMMTVRLIELRQVLKPSGSIYLHCDPTASHYLKVVMDTIFGARNFRNEVVWKRTTIHRDAKRFGRVSDYLLFYSKSDKFTWDTQYSGHQEHYITSHYTYTDPDGRMYRLDNATAAGQGPPRSFNGKLLEPPPGTHWRWSQENIDNLIQEGRIVFTKTAKPAYKRYLDEMPGTPVPSLWDDIPPINSQAKERLGYQTQKPLALLERIIQASSNEGDVVLDPFCGCGTAVVGAHKLNRRWIGIDITHLAITVMKKRLKDHFGLEPGREYKVVGEPVDVSSARALAEQDRFQFQAWAISLVNGQPREHRAKRGADRGIDGVLSFVDSRNGRAERAIVQVKSGHVNAGDIRDLKGTMEREKAVLGVFITLEPPTREMRTEAVSAGFHYSELWQRDFPKVQLVTIEELLRGKGVELPGQISGFAKGARIRTGRQLPMGT